MKLSKDFLKYLKLVIFFKFFEEKDRDVFFSRFCKNFHWKLLHLPQFLIHSERQTESDCKNSKFQVFMLLPSAKYERNLITITEVVKEKELFQIIFC